MAQQKINMIIVVDGKHVDGEVIIEAGTGLPQSVNQLADDITYEGAKQHNANLKIIRNKYPFKVSQRFMQMGISMINHTPETPVFFPYKAGDILTVREGKHEDYKRVLPYQSGAYREIKIVAIMPSGTVIIAQGVKTYKVSTKQFMETFTVK
jgi:hypothetical protein